MTSPRDGAAGAEPAAGGTEPYPASGTGEVTTGTAAPAGPAPGTPAPAARSEDRDAAQIEAELRGRLLRPAPTDRLWGWLGPLIVTALAAVLRLVNLNHPSRLIFDETYYVKQAYSLLTLGYEGEWEGEDVDDRFRQGDYSDLSTEADYVVHPPVGKWLIAIGLRLFGADNGAGWRFSAAVAGALTVLLLARVSRRLLGSTLLGTAAGFLLAVDGLHLTGSRTGLLDVFLGLFVLAGLGAVLLDREQSRRRLARAAAADLAERGDGRLSDPWGPRLGVRWWLVVAGVLLGVGAGVKWSAIYAVAVLGILVLVWDLCARRAVGARLWFGGGVFRGGVPAFFALVPVAAVTYVAGWASWFASSGGYLRQWAATEWAANGTVERAWLPHALNSWWEYHLRMWEFHNGLDSEHTYEAHPAGWLLQLRPTSFYWQQPVPGDPDCGGAECIEAITSVGNVALWWLGALALVAVLWLAVARRDWRAWTVLAGYAATYLPWFLYSHRTIFTFYAIALAPYVALALVLGLAWLTGLLPPLHGKSQRARGTADDDAGPTTPQDDDGALTPRDDDASPTAPPEETGATTSLTGARHRPRHAGDTPHTRLGLTVLGAVCLLATAVLLYFWPVWTGQTLPRELWHDRMWLGSLWV